MWLDNAEYDVVDSELVQENYSSYYRLLLRGEAEIMREMSDKVYNVPSAPFSGQGGFGILEVPADVYELAQSSGGPVTFSSRMSTETRPVDFVPIAASIRILIGAIAAVVEAWYQRSWSDAAAVLVEHGLHDMTVRDVEIVGHMMQMGEFTIPELMRATKASKITVWRTVRKLMEKGIVHRTEKTKLASGGLGERGKPSAVYIYVGVHPLSGNREVLAVILTVVLTLCSISPALVAQEDTSARIIVTPEENLMRWEEGQEIVVSPVQRGGTILRPRITVEWEDPGFENVDVEKFRGPRGEYVIKPFEQDGTFVDPKNVHVEWENVPILSGPIPEARERKVVPVENVRPPDLIVSPENFENLSPWQSYVTPWAPAVRELAWRMKSVEEAYLAAVGWIWVSDRTLHGVEEKWLYPQEFLVDTPMYPSNPVKGSLASDCESQAYTLVSVLRSIGIPPENVRVAVGRVQFGDQVGGHAWAEIYVYDRWMQLEVTSGPYWDDEEQRLVQRGGIPYDYFASNEYPALEVWAYFNDVYYYNTTTGEGNAPDYWHTFVMVPRVDLFQLLVISAAAVVVGACLAVLAYSVHSSRRRRIGRRGARSLFHCPASEPRHVFSREMERLVTET